MCSFVTHFIELENHVQLYELEKTRTTHLSQDKIRG